MKSIIESKNIKTYHLIGVGGVSMSALAKFLLSHGYKVTGSDSRKSKILENLSLLGASVYVGQDVSVVKKADLVIYSSAIKLNDPELLTATVNRIPTIKRSEFLGGIIKKYSRSVGVSGSHGKTTATAMMANAFNYAKVSPTVFLGGEDRSFGNFCLGESDICIAEVCEYQKNLLDILPKFSVILNIDNDHLDSYKDMEDMLKCFSIFASSGIAILNADDMYARQINHSAVVTFGIDNLANYSACRLNEKNGKFAFTAKAYGTRLGRINLAVRGKHNVYNALATIAVCDMLKIPFDKVKYALEHFTGVGRRMEKIGGFNGVNIICDYAHHPSEITATLKGIKEEKKAFIIFQPHTYSRTKSLMKEFCECLFDKENLIIYKTYPAREEFDSAGDGKTLYDKLISNGKSDCYYADNEYELKELITNLSKNGGIGLALGAGDIYEILKSLLNSKV